MIRGPRFGLGTCRYCCRWIFLLLALAALLPLFVHMQSAAGVARASSASSTSNETVLHRPSRNVRNGNHEHKNGTQRAQQQGLSVHSMARRKYKPALHDHHGSNVVEEGSILRLLSKNNLYIQSFPNGTVSATGHDSSYYSVLTQVAVGFGQIYIRGVASRLFLCINECGRLYGSEIREENCILRDQMEGNWYNTYTSFKYSTAEKSLFMAFSTSGSPCRLRLSREKSSDLVALGSHEKYALFFPVRNVSLPDGMNLTSLMQLNKRLSFARNTGQTTGCAPRCSKQLDHHHSAKEVNNKKNGNKKANRKQRKCRCNGSKCRRARHCQQTPRNSTVAASNEKRTPGRNHNKKSHESPPPLPLSSDVPRRNSRARNHLDFSLRFTHRNGEGRLIRHIYKKIRARPELADQLIALL